MNGEEASRGILETSGNVVEALDSSLEAFGNLWGRPESVLGGSWKRVRAFCKGLGVSWKRREASSKHLGILEAFGSVLEAFRNVPEACESVQKVVGNVVEAPGSV